MTQWPERLVLVGAGKMGGAMAQGWLAAGLDASSLTIVEPNPSAEIASLAASRGVALNPHIAAAPPEMLVLAVKPQSLDQVAPQIAALAGERTLLLSIIAGKTIRQSSRTPSPRARRCPRHAQHARCDRSGRHSRFCESGRQRGAAGLVRAHARRCREPSIWLDDEGAIDAVTAISGSGPAYIFALTEALAVAGERLGLPAELSMSLARGTVEGAAELMRRESDTSPATLRRNVTSPAGTTAAALAVLQDPRGLEELMIRAAAAAHARAIEMAG